MPARDMIRKTFLLQASAFPFFNNGIVAGCADCRFFHSLFANGFQDLLCCFVLVYFFIGTEMLRSLPDLVRSFMAVLTFFRPDIRGRGNRRIKPFEERKKNADNMTAAIRSIEKVLPPKFLRS